MESGEISGLTWLDKVEKELIDLYKQQEIEVILSGSNNYKMKTQGNRLEMEMVELRNSTNENYMLNKMANTDGTNVYVEYTLYKNYDKYFGLTLEGDSLEVIDVMEEEFAEFLYQYRLSITYPQVQAVHEDEDEYLEADDSSGLTVKDYSEYLEVDVNDLLGLTVEEYSEYVKQGIAPIQGVESEDAFMEDLRATVVKAKQLVEAYERYEAAQNWVITPEENESIKKQLEESKLAKFSPMYDEDDIEDEIKVDGEYDMNKPGINVDYGSDTYINMPRMWTETSTNTGEITKNSWIETPTNTSGIRAGVWKSNQPIEDNSKESFVSKIVADVMEELLTKGSCSLNITLNQD